MSAPLSDGPLSGYRVLELGSTVAGPFCGRLFADFGAEVIKVELPDGDPVRTMGSHDGGASLYAASILRNTSLVDYLTGLYAALGAVMALNARERSGEGQVVDAALYECGFSFMEPHVP